MQDRVSIYPGRVILTPVDGQENTYDMVRADCPTQEGTQLNKGNLLSDDTANKIRGIKWKKVNRPLSDYVNGSRILLPENGLLTPFFVYHDYETGLNGTGNTLLIREHPTRKSTWSGSNASTYAGSDLDNACVSYVQELDEKVRRAIIPAKFYVTVGGGNSSKTTLERIAFTLSSNEYGFSGTYDAYEGSQIFFQSPNGDQPLKAKEYLYIYTRTIQYISQSDNKAFAIYNGGVSPVIVSLEHYYRPCFLLPSTFSFEHEENEYGEWRFTQEEDANTPTPNQAFENAGQYGTRVIADVEVEEEVQEVKIDLERLIWGLYNRVTIEVTCPIHETNGTNDLSIAPRSTIYADVNFDLQKRGLDDSSWSNEGAIYGSSSVFNKAFVTLFTKNTSYYSPSNKICAMCFYKGSPVIIRSVDQTYEIFRAIKIYSSEKLKIGTRIRIIGYLD